jgi:hypothetical protein
VVARIALHNSGPGIARDVFLNLETWSPGPNSRVSGHVDSNRWAQEQVAGISTSTVSHESFRLGPLGVTSPLSLTIQLAQPFRRPLVCKISYGCAGSPGTFIERSVPASELDAIVPIEDRTKRACRRGRAAS